MMVSRGDHIPVTSEMTTMTFVNNTTATDSAPTVPTCKHKDVTCQKYAESKGIWCSTSTSWTVDAHVAASINMSIWPGPAIFIEKSNSWREG